MIAISTAFGLVMALMVAAVAGFSLALFIDSVEDGDPDAPFLIAAVVLPVIAVGVAFYSL